MPQGRPSAAAVVDLPPHDQPAGLLEQASRRRAHDQRGHQIFEHRSRPGDQRGAVRDRRDGAAEMEPVAGRDVALGDRDEAREPRLGGEQIVAARVERALGARGSRSRAACGRGRAESRNSIASAIARAVVFERPRGAPPGRRRRPPTDRCHAGGSRSSGAPPPSRTACRRRCRRPVRLASARAMSAMVSACAASVRQTFRDVLTGHGRPSQRRPPARRARRRAGATSPSASAARRAAGPASSRARSSASAMPARRRASVSGMTAPFPAGIGERDQVPGQIAAVDGGDVAADRAGADPACRTSCRNGRGSGRGGPWWPASPPAARPPRSFPVQPKSRAVAADRR